jgi:hypothetical protein
VTEEWLARIPDFALDPDRPPALGSGIVSTMNALSLVRVAGPEPPARRCNAVK